MVTSFDDLSHVQNDGVLDPVPEIKSMEFTKLHPVHEQDDEDLDFSTEIEAMIFQKPPLVFKNPVIFVNHQPFDEIPKPSQVKFSILESIGVEILGLILKNLRQAANLTSVMKATSKMVLIQILNSFVFNYSTANGIVVVVFSTDGVGRICSVFCPGVQGACVKGSLGDCIGRARIGAFREESWHGWKGSYREALEKRAGMEKELGIKWE